MAPTKGHASGSKVFPTIEFPKPKIPSKWDVWLQIRLAESRSANEVFRAQDYLDKMRELANKGY